ncbi:MAG: enoyl-CoA hydratase/isomerase family protein [Chloroflexota bacterium]
MFETIQVSAENGIGRLWLNRPKKLNPLSNLTLREIAAAASWFDEQLDVKVVIVGSEGRAFSAGADLAGFGHSQGAAARESADAGRRMADALENMRAISIARIHGWCVGGALVLAAACDLRVAAENAMFSIPEVDLGIPLAWGGIPRLVREIGPALTKELVITCRPFDAAEAKSAGFLNRVVTVDSLNETVEQLAQQITSKPTTPIVATKRHTNAVTAQMVGIMRGWSDADGLLASLADPECKAARVAYMKARGK